MRIGPSLILASRQTLAMTPQLQQAIKLLQFSHLELAAFHPAGAGEESAAVGRHGR